MLTSVSAGQCVVGNQVHRVRAISFSDHVVEANQLNLVGDGGGDPLDTFVCQPLPVVQHTPADDGGLSAPALTDCAIPLEAPPPPLRSQREAFSDLPVLISLYRQRVDLQRARQRLDLQCQSVVRRYSGGDKVVAAKRWTAIKKGAEDELGVILTPYQMAMEPLEQAQSAMEKALAKAVRKHPMALWSKGVLGLGEASLAAILSEAGRDLADYRSPAALWKRMGLAVMSDGTRQRRIAGEAALEHGYDANRRSLMWNVSACLIKAQVRKDPADEEARIAIGPLGQVYLDRKAYNLARGLTKFHAHNDAGRYIAKRLLRQMWSEARL